MSDNIYQIKIALAGSEPEIWRRILVPADLPLLDFHYMIQTTMGWTNSHLHQFIKDRQIYTVRYPDDDFWDDGKHVEYIKEKLRISDLLKAAKDRMMYNYDFGDDWMHTVVLEEIQSVDPGRKYPVCVDGAMNCPPEDSGGVPNYEDMLLILCNPSDEDYEDVALWMPADFDPEHFDKDGINKLLQEDNYGCIDLSFED